VRETALLESTLALLEWDERTGLPAHAGEHRADQVTILSRLVHQRKTSSQYGDWLTELSQSELALLPNSPVGASIRGMKRDFDKNIQLPEALVKSIAHAVTIGQQVWSEAKPKNDFAVFLPHLNSIVQLRREEASILSRNSSCRYDSLLDQYEEDARTDEVSIVFANLRERLVPLVQKLMQSKTGPDGKSIVGKFEISKQREFSLWVAKQIGFEFNRGRLDETDHPFCTTLGPNDHRILTRYHDHSFSSGLYGTLHEAGHGMYEQGLPTEWFGMPAGSAASLGLHESQSRLWENMVGRSNEFWKWCLPHAQKWFPQLNEVSVDSIYADLNRVEASLIRIEADEATYNLHILLRFELERELIDGELQCADLPSAWSDRYQSYLGIQPKNDSEGVMQDVHWAAGLIGYFPTYTLGNIFAAQLMTAVRKDLPDLPSLIAAGDFRPLLQWLRVNVHQHGRCLKPTDLIATVTGSPLSSQPFLDYLTEKLNPLHR
ncbi:MAG TPA: carboxypeptidase M32, partial [Pirellula sp.]|nr:carboxypeptidase M32 [Pirellula sp.]